MWFHPEGISRPKCWCCILRIRHQCSMRGSWAVGHILLLPSHFFLTHQFSSIETEVKIRQICTFSFQVFCKLLDISFLFCFWSFIAVNTTSCHIIDFVVYLPILHHVLYTLIIHNKCMLTFQNWRSFFSVNCETDIK